MEHEGLPEPTSDTTIPVPWGHISAKWWGSKNQKPIICIHGWQDNAGTFDTLIPLLPAEFSYLCLDLPGHGRSSHLPEGIVYYLVWEGVVLIRRLVKQYGWNGVSVMGHSLGGIIGFMYAAIFPDEIDMLISLDVVAPIFDFHPKYGSINNVSGYIDRFLHYDDIKSTKDPQENYDAMINITVSGHNNNLTRKSCERLMIRGMQPAGGDTYAFTRDNRVKVGWIAQISRDYVMRCAKRIKCRYLNVKAEPVDEETWGTYTEICDLIKSSCSDFKLLFVKGTHHVHLNEPEKIAADVSKFLLKSKSPKY